MFCLNLFWQSKGYFNCITTRPNMIFLFKIGMAAIIYSSYFITNSSIAFHGQIIDLIVFSLFHQTLWIPLIMCLQFGVPLVNDFLQHNRGRLSPIPYHRAMKILPPSQQFSTGYHHLVFRVVMLYYLERNLSHFSLSQNQLLCPRNFFGSPNQLYDWK